VEAESPELSWLEGYELTDVIAVGGMAEVFFGYRDLASDLRLPVVVKRLRPDMSADSGARGLFRDEARLATLLSHPFVVRALDIVAFDELPCIVMEPIWGEELNVVARKGLAADRFMPRACAAELMRQAALALGYCHHLCDEEGEPLEVVHRDVSPNNLLVTGEGFVKLIDFGTAQFRNQGAHADSILPGKLSYMSPEQVRRERVDSRSDVFSLGIILYEMTLGRRLFRGPAEEIRRRIEAADIEPPTFVDHDYPGFLESIVMRALERHPADRYRDGYELADELGQYLASRDDVTTGLEVARYLNELDVASGGQERPELVRGEDEDDDELDFDTRDEELPVGTEAAELAEWDELEEASDAMAVALGLEADEAPLVESGEVVEPEEPAEIDTEAPAETETEEPAETEEPPSDGAVRRRRARWSIARALRRWVR